MTTRPPPAAGAGQQGQAGATQDSVSAVAHIYTALADVLRDQISLQSDGAIANDLKCVALLAADLAVVVSLMLIRASDISQSIGGWWWYPLPAFVVSAGLLLGPVLRRTRAKSLAGGPRVPEFLKSIANKPTTLEDLLDRLLTDLQQAWADNDAILEKEARSISRGLYLLGAASVFAIGLYAWGLS